MTDNNHRCDTNETITPSTTTTKVDTTICNSSNTANTNAKASVLQWNLLPGATVGLFQTLVTTATAVATQVKSTLPPLPTPSPRSRDSLPIPPAGMEWMLTTTETTTITPTTPTPTSRGDTTNHNPKQEWRLVKVSNPPTDASAMTTPEPELITEAAAVAKDHTRKLPTQETSSSVVDRLPRPQPPNLMRSQSGGYSHPGSRCSHTVQLQLQQQQQQQDDWELLSDRNGNSLSSHHHSSNNSSSSTNSVVVQRYTSTSTTIHNYHRNNSSSGSVRSLSSMENHPYGDVETTTTATSTDLRNIASTNPNSNTTNNTNPLGIPFKIQRTTSSSTIDSCDNALGPLGKGILGVDYVEHVVLPTDTLQGLCISYKITSTQLRQANCFSGNSLLLAPSKLVIPISKTALRAGFIRVQDTDQKEYKVHAMLAEFPDFSMTEAKAYLELADWDLKRAIRSAKDDQEWEREMMNDDNNPDNDTTTGGCTKTSTTAAAAAATKSHHNGMGSLRSGEIRITPRLSGTGHTYIGFDTKGAGIITSKTSPTRTVVSLTNNTGSTFGNNAIEDDTRQVETTRSGNVDHDGTCAKMSTTAIHESNTTTTTTTTTTTFHTQTLLPDIYAQHNNFGVELQSIKPSSSKSTSMQE
jgi:LysM repeat protein